MMIDTGKTPGHYKMVSSLGAGGMGEIHLARRHAACVQGRAENPVCLMVTMKKVCDLIEPEANAAFALEQGKILTVREAG